MLKHLMNATALASLVAVLGLIAVAITPARAGVDCTTNDVNINGSFEGESFSTPARLTDPETGDNIGLSSQDCVTDNNAAQKARRDGRRAASIAAAMDTFGVQPGLNLTLNGANTGLGNDDTYAAGAVASYRHDFADPGVIHAITGKAGFGADTTGSDYGASVGLTLSFGTF